MDSQLSDLPSPLPTPPPLSFPLPPPSLTSLAPHPPFSLLLPPPLSISPPLNWTPRYIVTDLKVSLGPNRSEWHCVDWVPTSPSGRFGPGKGQQTSWRREGGREGGREGREQVREEGGQSQRGEGRKVLNYRLGVPKRISIRHLDKVQHTFSSR